MAAPPSTTSRAPKERLRTYQPAIVTQLLEDAAAAASATVSSQGAIKGLAGSSPDAQPVAHAAPDVMMPPLVDAILNQGTASRGRTAPPTLPSTSNGTMWERVLAQRQAKAEQRARREEAFRRAMQLRKLAQERAHDAAFEESYQAVLDGLEASAGGVDGTSTDAHILAQTQSLIEHKARIKARKQVALHQEWSTEVFDKIQRRLQSAVDARSDASITRRLKAQMDKYLHTTNTKLGVFRDVIIEADYDPLQAHRHDIRIPTGDIMDPVKRDVLKPQHERALMGLGPANAGQPPCKHMLDTKAWGTLAIQATPYGHNVDTSGNPVLVAMSAGAAAARKSRVYMDHYTHDPTGHAQAVEEELGRLGKRPVKGSQGRGGGGRNFFDVVQHTCRERPEVTGGDAWLEARGKGRPHSTDKRPDRITLTDVIQQAGNPYTDGKTQGDLWLEARGKAHPPGPELLRGRADLTEIICQSSNPYTDKRTLGDMWLEAKGKGATKGPVDTVPQFLFRMDCPPEPPKPKDARRYASCLVSDYTLHPTT